jgi:hypothetical protein
MAIARDRWVSSPYQVVWRPGCTTTAGFAAPMARAVSRICPAGISVTGSAHSGVNSRTWADNSRKPLACLSMYSLS